MHTCCKRAGLGKDKPYEYHRVKLLDPALLTTWCCIKSRFMMFTCPVLSLLSGWLLYFELVHGQQAFHFLLHCNCLLILYFTIILLCLSFFIYHCLDKMHPHHLYQHHYMHNNTGKGKCSWEKNKAHFALVTNTQIICNNTYSSKRAYVYVCYSTDI